VSARRPQIVLFVTLFMLLGIPAYAYADPSGGLLFQVLMPLLAGIWAAWMIFANRVRRMVSGFVRKMRGSEPDKPAV
jgi:Na+/proline symporter